MAVIAVVLTKEKSHLAVSVAITLITAMFPRKKLGRYCWVLVLRTKPQTIICSSFFRSYQRIKN